MDQKGGGKASLDLNTTVDLILNFMKENNLV
jgi:hypothetical protein